MNKEYAYVIQRDDGKYASIFYWVSSINSYTSTFCKNIINAKFFENKKECVGFLSSENCKPVKVEIKVVEDE